MTWPIQSMWIGDRLTAMERLSITSFLANGYDFHLYTYTPLADVPAGTVQQDANQILPASMIFRYADCGSYSGFANHFRYKLLLEQGGWWVDLDVVSLGGMPAVSDYAFASEVSGDGREEAGNCVMFSQPGTPLLAHLWDVVRQKDTARIAWCETGPTLIRQCVDRFDLQRYLLPAAAFCPIPYARWFDTFLPGRAARFGPETYGVHFWHEFWRRAQLDKDENYGPRSLYQMLKVRYVVSGSEPEEGNGSAGVRLQE